MYHYIRDLEHTKYPRLRSESLGRFVKQIAELRARFEMASIESALAFLRGEYVARRDLCLLTFDDGLKEHHSNVTPLLSEAGIQGAFFLITGCIEEERVAPVHMNHFLMAELDFELYVRCFIDIVKSISMNAPDIASVDPVMAMRSYIWDTPEVARFKYWFNFVLEPEVRDRAVRELFQQYIGEEREFSRELYLNWNEAREMQNEGMALGGHSHRHEALSRMSDDESDSDLANCRQLLDKHLEPQALLPFSYPYGKRDSFNSGVVKTVQRLAFACAFSTESGDNMPGAPLFSVSRLDCKKATS